MNKLTYSALAVSVVAGSAIGATHVKSVQDLANNIVTDRGTTWDDLSIGTLTNGSNVNGDTANSTDDVSGDDPAPGSWDGGDDVYSLQWGGGDLVIDLLFTMNGSTTNDGDLDLFLVGSASPDGSNIATSLTVDDNEQVSVSGLAAGKYWVVVDGWAGASNSYKLNVSPTPGAVAVFGLAGIAGATRRRR